jgi:hypothetical protein
MRSRYDILPREPRVSTLSSGGITGVVVATCYGLVPAGQDQNLKGFGRAGSTSMIRRGRLSRDRYQSIT